MCDNFDSIEQKNKNMIDQKFKSIIHRATILSWVLRSCVDELKDKSIDEIKQGLDIGADGFSVKGSETEQFSDENGPVRMDNIFDVDFIGSDERLSVIVNIEAQNNASPGYPIGKRAEYYISRLVSNQKGLYFKDSQYGDLRKTYSIWFMMDPHRENRKTIVRYRMRPEVIGNPKVVEELDTFNIIFINLGGEYNDNIPDELLFMSTLFSNDLSENERRTILSDKYKIPPNEYPKEELIGLGTLYEDTKNRYLREGKVQEKVDTAVFLITQKGYSLDEALEIVRPEDYMTDDVVRMIKENLQ